MRTIRRSALKDFQASSTMHWVRRRLRLPPRILIRLISCHSAKGEGPGNCDEVRVIKAQIHL